MSDQLDMFESKTLFDTNQELKVCNACKRELPLSCFGPTGRFRKDMTTRRKNVCRECVAKEHVTREELKQKTPHPDDSYQCPVCLKTKAKLEKLNESGYLGDKQAKWALDHNHDTGEFRGWLCNKCNSALGWLDDDLDNLKRAVKYLEEDEIRY